MVNVLAAVFPVPLKTARMVPRTLPRVGGAKLPLVTGTFTVGKVPVAELNVIVPSCS